MKRAILIVSFGSSNLYAYKLIEKFINKIRESIKEDVYIKYVFTSKILIKRMKEKNNIDILSIEEALNDLLNIGCKEVLLQPLHMMDGKDCDSLRSILETNKNNFNNIKLNPTLLTNKGSNTKESALNIVNAIKTKIDKERYVVLIGHGSNRCGDYCCYTPSETDKYTLPNNTCCNDDCYLEIEKAFKCIGYNNITIGTLEGNRSKEVIVKELKSKNIKDIVLMPLLVLPGNHIVKDIKGDDSWESLFKENNMTVEVILKSLLEYEEIQNLYIDMITEAMVK